MRGAFDTTVDLYWGLNNPAGINLRGTCPCKLVLQDGIFENGYWSPGISGYVTLDGFIPNGAFTGPKSSFDLYYADQMGIPSGHVRNYAVMWVEKIDWRGQPIYYRATVTTTPVLLTPPANLDPFYARPITLGLMDRLRIKNMCQTAYYEITLVAGNYRIETGGFFGGPECEVRKGPNWWTGATILAPSFAGDRPFTLAADSNIIIRVRETPTMGLIDYICKVY